MFNKLNKLYDIEVRKCINNNIRFNSDYIIST